MKEKRIGSGRESTCIYLPSNDQKLTVRYDSALLQKYYSSKKIIKCDTSKLPDIDNIPFSASSYADTLVKYNILPCVSFDGISNLAAKLAYEGAVKVLSLFPTLSRHINYYGTRIGLFNKLKCLNDEQICQSLNLTFISEKNRKEVGEFFIKYIDETFKHYNSGKKATLGLFVTANTFFLNYALINEEIFGTETIRVKKAKTKNLNYPMISHTAVHELIHALDEVYKLSFYNYSVSKKMRELMGANNINYVRNTEIYAEFFADYIAEIICTSNNPEDNELIKLIIQATSASK